MTAPISSDSSPSASPSYDPTKKSWFDMTYEERWSQSGLDLACNLWNLTDTKATFDLLHLKNQLVDLKEYHLNHPLEVARCYYDANFNLKTAEQKFRKMVEWRQTEGIDELLLEDKHQPPALLQEYYPSCFLDGLDRDGDPIWIDRTGASDVWAVYQKYGALKFRNYILRTREMALRDGPFARQYEQRTGHPPARCTVIMDMDGLCRRHLQRGLIAPLEEGIRLLQDYYGGIAKRIVVAKAPFVFRIVWNIAQYFCNESLKKAIVFGTAKNTLEILDESMDRKVLPPVFCPDDGEGKPGLGYPQITLEGGTLSEREQLEKKLRSSKNGSNKPGLEKLRSSSGSSSSNETVASCYSTIASSLASPPPSPTSSPRNSIRSSSSSSLKRSTVVVVKTTCLLSGFVHQEGDNTILLEELQIKNKKCDDDGEPMEKASKDDDSEQEEQSSRSTTRRLKMKGGKSIRRLLHKLQHGVRGKRRERRRRRTQKAIQVQ